MALKRALGTLPPRHRALMESLLAEPEPSYAEISNLLGTRSGASARSAAAASRGCGAS